jgi:hypothetical protein
VNKLSLDYKFAEEGMPHAKIYRATAVVAEEDKGKGVRLVHPSGSGV